jgi:uracil-DNA glycosylase
MDVRDQYAVIAAVLAWHEAIGVDAAVSADAIDWLSRGETAPGSAFQIPGLIDGPPDRAAPAQTAAATRAAPRASLLPPAQAPRPQQSAAPAIARSTKSQQPSPITARTLKELEAELNAFDGCGLKATAKTLCFYRGAETARLMIIGEAPGRDEDLEGKPFVGRAGQLLDKMLTSIGMTADQVHITNVVYWRPPGNRTPTPAETLACAPFLARQIELVAPDIILLLGAVAAKQMLDVTDGITKIRGNWFETNSSGRPIKTLPSLHPAYLLRTPASKRQAWRDMLAVKSALR